MQEEVKMNINKFTKETGIPVLADKFQSYYPEEGFVIEVGVGKREYDPSIICLKDKRALESFMTQISCQYFWKFALRRLNNVMKKIKKDPTNKRLLQMTAYHETGNILKMVGLLNEEDDDLDVFSKLYMWRGMYEQVIGEKIISIINHKSCNDCHTCEHCIVGNGWCKCELGMIQEIDFKYLCNTNIKEFDMYVENNKFYTSACLKNVDCDCYTQRHVRVVEAINNFANCNML